MMRSVAASAAALTLAAAGAAHAGFTGDTVSADYAYPNVGNAFYPSGTAVVGAGVEFNNIGGFGVGISPAVDFTDTNILFTYPGGWSLAGFGTFDGWVVTNFSSADIVGVSLAGTNIAGLTGSVLSFDANHVFVNTLGLGNWGAGSFISVDVAFANVPEPATWALMIIGFGAAGVAVRRRQRVAA